MAKARYSKEKGFVFLFGWAYPKKYYDILFGCAPIFLCIGPVPPVTQFDEFSAIVGYIRFFKTS